MRLRLERPRLARTAVVLDAAPPEPIWRLRELLRTADLQVRDTGATPLPAGPASPPHVSVAYARRAANAGALAATLEALAPGPIELDVRDVDLLRLRRDYTWETLATVELCGEPARQ
jgi:hypothetical protein